MLAESGFGERRALARGQFAVKPGRSVACNLLFEIEGGEDADRDLRAALRVMARRSRHEILRNAPMVGVDALDDASAAQRFQSPDVTADIALGVPAGDANGAAFDKCTVLAWAIFAVVTGHIRNVAIGRSHTSGSATDLDDAPDCWGFATSRLG